MFPVAESVLKSDYQGVNIASCFAIMKSNI